jgi:hypothetical protein
VSSVPTKLDYLVCQTGLSDFPSFEQKLLLLFVSCVKHFGDSAGELATSSTSSMKGGNSDNNRSDLDKDNILKPTFDTLTDEGHKSFEGYRANLEVHFLSRCKVMRHGTILKDTTMIVFNKPELIPEVRLDPLPSHNDIQSMVNFVLERQAKY